MKKLKIALAAAAIAAAGTASADAGKILVVASSETQMALRNGKTTSVGYFLNELAVPSLIMKKAGYEIELATPKGNVPVMDKGSDSDGFFQGSISRADAKSFAQSLKPISLKEALARYDSYSGIFVPGGHAPMTDLMQNPELGQLLSKFHSDSKPIGFICHGPAAILAAVPKSAEFRKAMTEDDSRKAGTLAEGFPFKGYRMTVFSDAEEWPGEVSHDSYMPFHVEDALLNAGMNIEIAPPYTSHLVVDRELISGQNPASDEAVGNAMVQALKKAR
jgi:putative intracellular protease/amidase